MTDSAHEPLPLRIFESRGEAARAVAGEIAALMRERAALGNTTVLGLASGNTPIVVYDELARLHAEEGLDFSAVKTFNLDEYLGLAADHRASFGRFMSEQLFERVDLAPENVSLPRVDASLQDVERSCEAYEQRIVEAGGVDLQILGIGRNGHVGFNEPGTRRDSRTRRVELHPWTRADYAAQFGTEEVPREALTVGVATILEARRIRLLAFGQEKAQVVRKLVEEGMTTELPASLLRGHLDLQLILDGGAASMLKGRL